jgi:putative ABC transport system ATP-binding protein
LAEKEIDLNRASRILVKLVAWESSYIKVVVIYGSAISLLTLAVPIAVQTLINTVANIASTRAILILSGVLLLTLVLSGGLSALRTHVMELYERKIYARLTSEISLRTILAPHSVFEGRRNSSITQRYFEIMTLQKNIPSLMVDGFALLLQLLVGFSLVSFYHPMLFLFNLLIILLIYLIWLFWGAGAKITAIKLSHAKYETARWLNDLSAAHEFFKSSQHMDYAARTTEALVDDYVSSRENHFKYTFAQVLAFLLLYAVASAGLLGLGGWLVVRGELSIGQLVAAELIMSAVFFGLSQFTNYMKMYYELYGAADKIGQLLELPQEVVYEDQVAIPADSTLECHDLVLSHQDYALRLSFKLGSGTKAFVSADTGWVQRKLTRLLKMQDPVQGGWLRIGGLELAEYDVYDLGQAIAIVDRSLIVECTIKEYLRMAAPKASLSEITSALALMSLGRIVDTLPDGLETRLSTIGAPLLPLELLLMKLAAAVLAQPQLVILNQDFDNLPADVHKSVLQAIQAQPFSMLYFTRNPDKSNFDAILELNADGSGNGSQGLQIMREASS